MYMSIALFKNIQACGNNFYNFGVTYRPQNLFLSRSSLDPRTLPGCDFHDGWSELRPRIVVVENMKFFLKYCSMNSKKEILNDCVGLWLELVSAQLSNASLVRRTPFGAALSFACVLKADCWYVRGPGGLGGFQWLEAPDKLWSINVPFRASVLRRLAATQYTSTCEPPTMK